MKLNLLVAIIGFWVVMRSVNKDSTGRTLVDHIVGNKASQSPLLNLDPGSAAQAGLSAASSAASGVGIGGAVDPFPGATGSRLDQGFDLTGKSFLAPFSGKVLVSEQSDPGWRGGGYIAIQNSANPQQVIYMAEGISPVVPVGATVTPGQIVGHAVLNPYNQILGNIEAGWASPSSPKQPLAQTIRNRPSAAESFYQWLLSLGGPRATSTASAGYP